MTRITLMSKTDGDGVLHLDLPLGDAAANQEVQMTIEGTPSPLPESLPTMSARDLLNSGLVGMWSNRTDVGDSQAFARRLREEAQTRGQNS